MVLYLKMWCALVRESAGIRDVDGTATIGCELSCSLHHDETLVLMMLFERWPFQFLENCSDAALSLVVVCHKSCCPPIDLLEFILIFLQVLVPVSTAIFHDGSNQWEINCLLCLFRWRFGVAVTRWSWSTQLLYIYKGTLYRRFGW